MRREEYLELLDKFSILERLDERTSNIWKTVERMEKHQVEQNGHITESLITGAKNTTSIKWVWRVFMILGGSGVVGGVSWNIWG